MTTFLNPCKHIDQWLDEDHKKRLLALYQMLEHDGYYALAYAPFPANHGAPHIDHVMRHVASLLKAIDLNAQLCLGEADVSEHVFELGAAVLLHDIAMGAVAALTKVGPDRQRRDHATMTRLEAFLTAAAVGACIDGGSLKHIKIIAWGHAEDPDDSEAAKLAWIDRYSEGVGRYYMRVWVRLLRLADLLDLGPHRLVHLPPEIEWDDRQKIHREIHEYAEIEFRGLLIEIRHAQQMPHREEVNPSQALAKKLNDLTRDIDRQITDMRAWIPDLRLVNSLLPEKTKQIVAYLNTVLADNPKLDLPTIQGAIRHTLERRSYSETLPLAEHRGFRSGLPQDALIRCRELFAELAVIVGGYERLSLQHLSKKGRRMIVYGEDIDETSLSMWLLRPVEDDELIKGIVRSRQTLVIDDTGQGHSGWVASSETQLVKSWACIPIPGTERVCGLITIDHAQPGHFRRESQAKLDAFAKQHGPILEWILSQYTSARVQRHAEIIENIIGAFSEPVDTTVILKTIVEQIASHLSCAKCTIFIAERSEGKTNLVAKRTSRGPQLAPERRFSVDEGGLAVRVFKTGKAELFDDATKDPAFFPATYNRAQSRSMVIAPIKCGDECIGVICADQDAYGWFNDYDLKLLETIGKQAGIILRRSEMIETLHSITTDLVGFCSDFDEDCHDQMLKPLLRRIVDGAIQMTNATTGVIYRINAETLEVIDEYAPKDYIYPKPRMDNPRGLTRTVIREGKTLPLPDVRNGPYPCDVEPCDALKRDFASVIVVPLKLVTRRDGVRVIGTLFLDYNEPHSFPQAEITFLEVLGGQSAAAIRNAELIRDLRDRGTELSKLERQLGELHKSTDLQTTIGRVGKDVVGLLGSGVSATVDLYDAALNTFVDHYAFGELSGNLGMKPRPDGTGHHVVKHRTPLYYADTRTPARDQPLLRKELEDLKVVSFAALPLLGSTGVVLGVLFINSTRRLAFGGETKKTLDIFCSHAVIALENSCLYQRARQN